MTLVIGTDEAGYGPNLGPLVVAATAWHVEAPPEEVERTIQAAVAEVAADRLWGDSKQIYRGGGGLAALERGALAGIALAAGRPPCCWDELSLLVGCHDAERSPEHELLVSLRMPVEPRAGECQLDDLAARLAGRGIRLAAVRVRVVSPGAFNRLLDAGLNKSDLLSQATLDLAAGLTGDAGPTVVWCDRHGGRKRYAPLVARHFSAPLVQAVEETAERSAYAIPARGLRIEFSVGGEARTPVALASMTAKYVRELAMLAFNEHWGRLAPGVATTAGYPVDAGRWRREAGSAVERAGVPWDMVWRRA